MTPDFSISANGRDVTGKIRQGLVSLVLADKDGLEADTVTITIADPEWQMALPATGASLRISMGWKETGLVDKGLFIVDEVSESGPVDCVTIVARSADFRDSLKQSRDQAYNDTSLGAVLGSVAARNGLVPAVHPELAARPVVHLSQTNESDVNLVTRLGDDHGAMATIKSGRLVFVPWGRGLTASGIVLGAVHLDRADGDTHTFRRTERSGSQTGVQAKWVDTGTGRTNFALAGTEGSVKTLKRTFPNQAEAQAAADAAWARNKSKTHEFSVTRALGDAAICAASPLTLSGWRKEITRLAWITGTVTHSMDENGFTTQIEANELVGD